VAGKNHNDTRFTLWATALSCLLLISGCGGDVEVKKDHFLDKWKAIEAESRPHSPSSRVRDLGLPEKKTLGAIEEEPAAAPEKPLPTQKISLKMHNVDVAVILRALAGAASQNIMINSNVEGKIDINVKNTPWDQVFRGVLRTQGLAYKWEGEIIRILTVKDMEHDLKLAAIQEKKKAQEIGLQQVKPLITKVVYIDYADAKPLKESLLQFLTKDKEGKPRGNIMVDEHTNALIIQAIRDDIVRMIPIIQKLDRPTPQVLIEAVIVEATKEAARELGIQWGGLIRAGDTWITPGANSQGVLGNSITQPVDPTTGLAVNLPADFLSPGQSLEGLTLGLLTAKLGRYLLTAQLSAMEEEGKLNILSSPSISTVDNQKALIESGREVPYQTNLRDVGFYVEYKKVTLLLEVTPHVIEGNLLKLNILTHKDEIDFQNDVQGNPVIITKRAKTNLILYDGQTTVIGGLTKDTKGVGERGVPIAKDVPYLGQLFRKDEKTHQFEDLLIFITPHILPQKVAKKGGSRVSKNMGSKNAGDGSAK
jgi:type IV pilus assembly protein PilQ